MPAMATPTLREILSAVVDRRQARGRRHELGSMLAAAIVAILCGCGNVNAIAEWGPNYGRRWQARLGFARHGWPCKSTWYRVLSMVEVKSLEACLSRWSQAQVASRHTGLLPISVDGKTLRGSRRQGAQGSHLLGALCHELGVMIQQVAVENDSNEIAYIATLLAEVAGPGRVITADALLTQKAVARRIVDAQGHYVLQAKDNQPGLRALIAAHFTDPPPKARRSWEYAQHCEKSHGRLTVRRLWVSDQLADVLDWRGLSRVFLQLTVTRRYNKRPTTEIRYGLTSLKSHDASADEILAIIRGHWAIENRSHWVRDVVFREDWSSLRSGRAHQAMAALRNTAISLLRLNGHTAITKATRRLAARPHLALRLVRTA